MVTVSFNIETNKTLKNKTTFNLFYLYSMLLKSKKVRLYSVFSAQFLFFKFIGNYYVSLIVVCVFQSCIPPIILKIFILLLFVAISEFMTDVDDDFWQHFVHFFIFKDFHSIRWNFCASVTEVLMTIIQVSWQSNLFLFFVLEKL